MSVKIYFEFHTVRILLSVLIKIPNPILQPEILFAGRWKASRIIENSLESRVLEKLESVKLKKGHWSNYPWIDGSIAVSLDFLAAKTAARDWPEFIRTAVKIMVILRSLTISKIMLGSKKRKIEISKIATNKWLSLARTQHMSWLAIPLTFNVC